MIKSIDSLSKKLKGELYTDTTLRTLYATDASAYREMPLAVAIPQNEADLRELILFAGKTGLSLIPRTAGTSLAGQVVGSGIVVDVSKHLNKILEVNKEEGWVRVQPGVVRDELNMFLKEYGLYFGPETSTANRAMIGGMLGNNSCGSNSVVYGSTREHVMEVRALLSDGSIATFGPLSKDEFAKRCEGKGTSGPLESAIYRHIRQLLSNEENRKQITEHYPKASISRRNTGYALDLLMDTEVFSTDSSKPFNFCSLLAGSEGTLAIVSEIKLHVDPLPPAHKALVCAHFNTVDESLRANLIALKYKPSASELMDHYVMECTKANIEQRQNRFFVQGDPGALLVVEFACHTPEEVKERCQAMIADMQAASLGYHFPVVEGDDIKKVWNLRKAGLGLLSNIPGDAKPVAVVEDTAVDVNDLPEYIADFNRLLQKRGLYCVHYAHAGSGEIHLRPIINLKTEEGNQLFKAVATDIAQLVKQYRGSLSGEHGDGRLRGEFIPYMIGAHNYQLLCEVKNTWDPQHIFNPGKITETPPMNTALRYAPGQDTPQFNTAFDFSAEGGMLRAAELCNGSGDCRKSQLSGGTMCPSFMATRNEQDTTRARANILRETMTHAKNPFAEKAPVEVLDLCLSCKGCKSECPSNVDMARLKAEALYQHYKHHGVPFRSRLIGNFTALNTLASAVPGLYNFVFSSRLTAPLAKRMAGFAPQRSIPLLHKHTLKGWWHKNRVAPQEPSFYLFADEFTNFNDVPLGITAITLFEKLGFEPAIPLHVESGRAAISKGMLDQARSLANKNVSLLKDLVSETKPLVGIEPSAILSFRDEYPDLVSPYLRKAARELSRYVLLADEWIAQQSDTGRITKEQFSTEERLIKLHGHCHQKALASLVPTKKMLTLPVNYKVHLIPSGCCGMAGSFGYEAEHYELSMQIAELVLAPAVRALPTEVMVAAPGTSCRHQIKDATGRQALHPLEILYQALR